MKSVDIIMIPVKDRQKAKEFYLKLGFQIIVEAPDPHGEAWIQMGLPNSSTSISLAGFQGIICETENIENEIKSIDHLPQNGKFVKANRILTIQGLE